MLLGEVPIERAIVATQGGFDLLPGNSDLTAAEIKLMDEIARESRLKDALAPVASRYHFILIDCPPSLGMLTLNALTAARGRADPDAVRVLRARGPHARCSTPSRRVRQRLNPELDVEGLLRTMYDVRNNLGNEVSAQLLKHFGDKVFRTIVPRNVRLAEAPSHGIPISQYDRESRGAIAYLGLAGEMLRRERAPAKPVDPHVA